MKSSYFLIGISLFLVIVVIVIVLLQVFTQNPATKGPFPTPTRFPLHSEESIDYDEPPPPGTNPAYLQKIEEQPFWEMLPYFTTSYKIEYKDSDNKIVITTISGTPEQIGEYRNSAVSWLRSNGARTDSLRFEYVIAR